MSGSFEKINYTLRPAKSIERKMLCEAFHRLSSFGKIECYSYVGFGSTYFSDFSLFHKSLNIQSMISIEKHEGKKDRFEFNKPFRCIEMCYGSANTVLPTINWDSRKIVWLDYDGELSNEVLLDIKTLCLKVKPGSIILVSVNVNPKTNSDIEFEDIQEYRINELTEAVGINKIPIDVKDTNLANWGTAKICREIIHSEIVTALTTINVDKGAGAKLCYEQLFNFHYSDNAKMLTVGGIIFDEGQQSTVQQCSFDDLSFVAKDTTPYLIEIPNLTFKEIRCIDEQLPKKEGEIIMLPSVRPTDIEKYEKNYRFFPTFTEANL